MIIKWDDSSLIWPTPDYKRIFSFSNEIKENMVWKIIEKIDKFLKKIFNSIIGSYRYYIATQINWQYFCR